ncbi:MAG: hypothetical protein R3E02_12300 [Blastomonas sp.]
MLVQRCALEQHRIIVPASISRPILTASSFQISPSGQYHYRALVDTGAQRTVISKTAISEQNLVRIGHMQFAGIHGPQTHTRYLCGIGLWANRIDAGQSYYDSEPDTRTLFLLEEPIEIVDMEPNANFDLILGWDVLKQFSFSFDMKTRSFELVVQQ